MRGWLAKATAELSLWDLLLMVTAAAWMVFVWAVRQLFRGPADDELGMAWWNALSEPERARWVSAAGSAERRLGIVQGQAGAKG
jgi:hypothetical protein